MVYLTTDFEWFIFQPLTLKNFSSHLKVSNEQAKIWYKHWCKLYNKLASLFYASQYERHQNFEFKKFVYANNLNIEYICDLDGYYYEDWNKWQHESENLMTHYQEQKTVVEETEKEEYEIITLAEANQLLIKQIEDGWNPTKIRQLKELWFSLNMINYEPEELKKLKNLSYSNYLKTSHWRRVRAAMLLIEKAVCSKCFGESYYGGDWEKEIHVHHLSYRNKGCEAYQDLTLLCRVHHEKEHKNHRL